MFRTCYLSLSRINVSSRASKEINTFKVAVFQAQDSKKGSSFKSCSVYIPSVRKIESSVKIMV